MPTVASSPAVDVPVRSTGWRGLLLAAGVAALVAYVAAIAVIRVTSTQTEGLQPGATLPTKITTTTQPLGDTVTSALLGAAVILMIAGAFYDRIKKVTGPGGIVVEFDSEEKEAAAAAVADQVKNEPSPAKDAMTAAQPADEQKAVDVCRDLSHLSIKANLDTLQQARDLLKIAHSSPGDALKVAEQWGLPTDLSEKVAANLRIPTELWPALASRALRRTTG